MKFTIDQLLFANEICFPADFEKAYKKAAKGTKFEGEHSLAVMRFKREFKSNLLAWINTHSRADLERGAGKLIDGILIELIGDYGSPRLY